MTPSMISMLLWAPFAFVMLIAGLIFISAGYKKGLFTALFSLVATLLAVIASLPLANLLGEILGELLASVISQSDTYSAFVPVIAGVTKGVASVVLFGLLFFFITLVLKLLMQVIVGRRVEKTGGAMRAGGVVVRALDTVLYTLLLLLPLYGTLGVYGPTATMAVELLESAEELGDGSGSMSEVYAILKTVTDHPLVSVTTSTPITVVYDELAAFELDGGKVSPVEMMKTATEFSEKIGRVLEENNEDLEKDLTELIDFMDDAVLDAEWSYAICMSAFDEISSSVQSQIPEEEKNSEYGQMVLRVLDDLGGITQKEYKKIGASGLDFLQAYLNALAEEGRSLTDEGVTDAFFEKHGLFRLLGEVCNTTSRMADLRTLYYTACAQDFCGSQNAAADLFLSAYEEAPSQRDDVILADGRIMAHFVFISDDCTKKELFLAHPFFGSEAFHRAGIET